MSAATEAAERAARLRTVLAGCQAILADPDASEERKAAANRWLNRLGGTGTPADNAYGTLMSGPSTYVHHTGGNLSLKAEADYDGWDRRH